MSAPAKTPWRIAGEEVNGCNCAWGPCQFIALPTHGRRVATYVDISKHVGRVNRESMVLDEMAA